MKAVDYECNGGGGDGGDDDAADEFMTIGANIRTHCSECLSKTAIKTSEFLLTTLSSLQWHQIIAVTLMFPCVLAPLKYHKHRAER